MTLPNGREKHRSRDNRRRVNRVLNTKWDPIGVTVSSPDDDEYASYAADVYVMLMQEGASVEDIADYLHRVATDHIGLSDTPYDRSLSAARAVYALKRDFETRTQ